MERLVVAGAYMCATHRRKDVDFVDRLNHHYTTFLFVLFSILVSMRHYVGEAILCWCPAEFTDNHLEWVYKYCWVSNTYYVPITQKDIPEPTEKRYYLGYYQYVPLILLFQGLLFYLPSTFWRLANHRSGVDIKMVVEAARNLQRGCYFEERDVILKCMVTHLDAYLSTVRNNASTRLNRLKTCLAQHCFLFCGRQYGNYLSAMYLVMKLLNMLNVVVQFLLLNAILGDGYHMYGIRIIQQLIYSNDWESSARFPRVTICDFSVRKMGNIQPHTVQCVLPINLFNEKIYMIVWFWVVVLALITVANFILWLHRSSAAANRIAFVSHLLKSVNKTLTREDWKFIPVFVNDYLRKDGVLLMRIIATNSDDVVVAEVLNVMWGRYCQKCGRLPAVNPALSTAPTSAAAPPPDPKNFHNVFFERYKP